MPEIGLSSAKEACEVKSLRGIQYLDGLSDPVIGFDGKAG